MAQIELPARKTPGTYASREVTCPARSSDEATRFRAVLDLPAAALANVNLVIDIVIEGTTDGVNWREFARGDGWQGGQIGRDGNPSPPRISWHADDDRLLQKVRVRWRQNRTADVGVQLDMEPVTRGNR